MTHPEHHPTSIHVINLGKRFNREWIFRDFSHEFAGGTTYALTGPNGSGKSTLLQVLSGFTLPSRGEIRYFDGNVEIAAEDIFRTVTVAAPYMELIDEFSLEEQLQFHFRLKKARAGISVPELIDIMQLGNARSKFIGNFSSGMKQRVKLALAFYTEAKLVFLDEPGTNLDRQAFEWYRHELRKLPPDCLVVIASNNAEEYPETARMLDMMAYK